MFEKYTFSFCFDLIEYIDNFNEGLFYDLKSDAKTTFYQYLYYYKYLELHKIHSEYALA